MKTTIIKGFENYSISENGTVISPNRQNGMKHVLIGGYPCLRLCKDGRQYTKSIHRLLALHFLPNPNNYPQVNHIDGNKLNYSLDNLEWCTISHNIQHSWDNKIQVVTQSLRDSARRNILNANKDKMKPVLNTETGIFYDSVNEAAKTVNMYNSSLEYRMMGKSKKNKKTPFIYV